MLSVRIHTAGYSKNNLYLNNVNFDVNKGEIIGLIGANGAGKSTTIKSILGIINEFEGNIGVEENSKTSYIPEEPILYENLTLWEHLMLAAASHDLPENIWIDNANELLELFRLFNKKDSFPIHFSKGMKQKTLIVLGFMVKPDIYIIDEPFIGLDPIATKTLISLLLTEKKRGASILMSTHVLDTAEKICDRFILLSDGVILSKGNLDAIRKDAGQPKDTSFLDCFNLLLERAHND